MAYLRKRGNGGVAMGHFFIPVMMLAYARQFGPVAEALTKAWIFQVYGFVPPKKETPEYGK